jgi:4-hydroxybenzoate polyprenyltransferase
MAPWLTYLKERFPFSTYVLLVGGFTFSGLYLAGGALKENLSALSFSFWGLMIFFALLRLMDELKDYDKDVIAHPERPLPRGVLKVAQVNLAIKFTAIFMLLGGGIAVLLGASVSGLLYVFITLYLWLMFKEFFVGSELASYPALYGFSHQIIIVPLCLFTVATVNPSMAISSFSFFYGFSILGSFFTYEVCRKLDPRAHHILKTYLYIYGPKKIILFILCTSLVAMVADFYLGLAVGLWPLQILILASSLLLLKKPEKYKITETFAVLGLVAHLWAIPIAHYAGVKF